MVHAWDEEEHPNLMNRTAAPKAKVLLEPLVNPAPAHREIWLEDPDGYVVVIASPDGEAPGLERGAPPAIREASGAIARRGT